MIHDFNSEVYPEDGDSGHHWRASEDVAVIIGDVVRITGASSSGAPDWHAGYKLSDLGERAQLCTAFMLILSGSDLHSDRSRAAL